MSANLIIAVNDSEQPGHEREEADHAESGITGRDDEKVPETPKLP